MGLDKQIMGDYSESKYGVFIIESMDTINESNGKLDGQTLKQILDLCDILNTCYYIRTRLELEKIIEEFEYSGCHFLHLSRHANSKGIKLTYESLDFEELDLILGCFLHHRRLFLSACKVAVFELAEHSGKHSSKIQKTQFKNQYRTDNDVGFHSDSSDRS